MSTPLEIAVDALERISDPGQTSLRHRDRNCARYVASDALDALAAAGVSVGGTRWGRGTNVAGDVYPEPSARG